MVFFVETVLCTVFEVAAVEPVVDDTVGVVVVVVVVAEVVVVENTVAVEPAIVSY
jgi:hypothetical protein